MRVKWLGNSCIEIFSRKHILIDPNFLVSPEPKVDYILVTHEHADHFDMDCFKATEGSLIAPKQVLDEFKLEGVEATPGMEMGDIKILKSHCWNSPESVSYLVDGLLHSGDSAKLPDADDVRVIFTACFPSNYDDYISEFRRLGPELVVPIHYKEEKKDDAIGLGERVKEAGMNFRILEVGEALGI